jgi:hypothetical protein
MCRYPDKLIGVVLTELYAIYREKRGLYYVVLLIELYKYREPMKRKCINTNLFLK